MELKKLKSEYLKLEKIYKLPDFKVVNECFEIDKIDRDTDLLLREIRKTMMDKIIGYKRFIEMMINPSAAPPMFTIFIKEVTKKEKELIEDVYKSLVKLEMDSFNLEVDYSEKEEARVVSEIHGAWNNLKPHLREVSAMMERNWNAASTKKEKAYFG